MVYHGIDLITALLHPERGLLERFRQTRELHDKNLYTPAVKSNLSPSPVNGARLPDGSWTDRARPAMGSAGMPFGRNIQPGDAKREQQDVHRGPNPLKISEELLHSTKQGRKPASTLNVLAAAWIQFQVHDWFNHDKADTKKPVDLKYGNRSISFSATKPAAKTDGLQTYSNTQVHWWDGSQLYGNDADKTRDLRAPELGKLKFDAETDADGRPLLPLDPETGFDLTGFNSNWWVGLSLMHTLFVYEHNAICDKLHASGVLNPPHAGAKQALWNDYDERLFETARLINGALMAKIHSVEWTPAVLDDDALIASLLASWWGVDIPDLVLEYFPRCLLALLLQELAATGSLSAVVPLATLWADDLFDKGADYSKDKKALVLAIDRLERRWPIRQTMEWLFREYEALRPHLGDIEGFLLQESGLKALVQKLASDGKLPPYLLQILQRLQPAIENSKTKAVEVLRLILEYPVETAIRDLAQGMADVLLACAGDERICEIAGTIRNVSRILLGEVVPRMEKPERHLHGVDYAMTEEFVSVYRMHPLLPDEITVGEETLDLQAMLLTGARKIVKKYGLGSLTAGFGTSFPGAITLNNQPAALNSFVMNGNKIDVGALDIYRDRERGVPRYKRFRELLRNETLRPDFDFRDVTEEKGKDPIAEKLKSVYANNIDDLDLMVGLYSEPIPDGFAFCETAFRVFAVMAPRRLAADPFFTSDYGPEVYTQTGIDWINDRSMRDVLRHVGIDLHPSVNPFVPWHVRDHSGHALKSRQFRNRLLAYYADRGTFIRRPKGQRFLAKAEREQKDLRLAQLLEKLVPRSDLDVEQEDLDAFEQDYRSGGRAFWLRLQNKTKTLVLCDRHAIRHVLENSPKKYGPGSAKERGMKKFQPYALTITEAGDTFDVRRALAEDVLGFGRRVHEDGEQLLDVVDREIGQMEIKDSLGWNDIDDLSKRISQKLVLGRVHKDLFSQLEALMERGNLAALKDPGDETETGADLPLQEFESKLESAYQHAQAGDTLCKRLATAIKDPTLTAGLKAKQIVPHGQIIHWLFAIRGTFAVHTAYTLYLLARHPNAQEDLFKDLAKVSGNGVAKLYSALLKERKTINDRLVRLEQCILEAARLWPGVPLITRRATGADDIPLTGYATRINKDEEILIHNVANNRDPRFIGQCPHAFKPDRWKPRGVGPTDLEPRLAWYAEGGDYTTIFSNGPQTCPGRDFALLLIKAIVGRLVLEHKFSLYEPAAGDELPVSLDQFGIRLKSAGRG